MADQPAQDPVKVLERHAQLYGNAIKLIKAAPCTGADSNEVFQTLSFITQLKDALDLEIEKTRATK